MASVTEQEIDLDAFEAGDGSDNADCQRCRDWGTVLVGGEEVPCPAAGCRVAAKRADGMVR